VGNEKGVKRRRRRSSSLLSAQRRRNAQDDVMTLPRQLCENFCAYYKPGKDEELSCLAFAVVEGLIRKGMRIPLKKSGTAADRDSFSALLQNMCPACSFYEDGCDFAAGKADSQPCGGVLLLGQMMGSKAFDVDDLKNMD
jgi:hypothetical protein